MPGRRSAQKRREKRRKAHVDRDHAARCAVAAERRAIDRQAAAEVRQQHLARKVQAR